MSVASPCIRHCCLNDDDICLGCFRSIEEIMQWAELNDKKKRGILLSADERKKKHQEKYPLYQHPEN